MTTKSSPLTEKSSLHNKSQHGQSVRCGIRNEAKAYSVIDTEQVQRGSNVDRIVARIPMRTNHYFFGQEREYI